MPLSVLKNKYYTWINVIIINCLGTGEIGLIIEEGLLVIHELVKILTKLVLLTHHW